MRYILLLDPAAPNIPLFMEEELGVEEGGGGERNSCMIEFVCVEEEEEELKGRKGKIFDTASHVSYFTIQQPQCR